MFSQESSPEKAEEEICLESGETSRRETPHRELPAEQPPQWFYTWMDKVLQSLIYPLEVVERYDARHEKTGLNVFIVVIPKEG